MNAKSNSLSSSLVLALVLACGANMAWFMTCMIVFAVSEPWFPNSNPGHAGFASCFRRRHSWPGWNCFSFLLQKFVLETRIQLRRGFRE